MVRELWRDRDGAIVFPVVAKPDVELADIEAAFPAELAGHETTLLRIDDVDWDDEEDR